MKKLILIIVIFLAREGYGQMLHFKVVNAESLKPIPEAKVTSSANKGSVMFTNIGGDLILKYLPGDTISISKNAFHSIHLYLPKVNVDSVHVITISMVPGLEDNADVKKISGLPMFEYYFVHTDEDKSNLKVQVFENKNAIQQRQSNAFKIASIHLNDFHPHQKNK
jgi:ABC-type antimicrobial peptide transport system permease subunit